MKGGRGADEEGAGGGGGAEEEGGVRGHAAGRDALREPRGEERRGGGGAAGLPRAAQGRRALGAVQAGGKEKKAL